MRKAKPSNAPFLFDRQNAELIPRDTHVLEAPEVKRLAGQNALILARLQQGPATNRELVGLAINYRARVSDLRAVGYNIPPPVEDRKTGVAWYHLES